MSFKEQIKTIYNQIYAYEFERASVLHKQLLPQTNIERRIYHHIEAKILYMQGNYAQSASTIKVTIEQFGKHIGLSCDLINCLYNLNFYEEWGKELDSAFFEFEKYFHLMNNQTQVNTAIFLGKLYEERANLFRANELFLKLYNNNKSKDSGYYYLLANLIRFYCSYNLNHPELAIWYKDLICLKETNSNLFLDTEIQHALIWSEYLLLGKEAAIGRMESVVSSPQVDLIDKNFCFWELVSNILLRKDCGCPLLNPPVAEIENLYHQKIGFLYTLIKNKEGSINWNIVQGWIKDVTLTDYLVLLNILNINYDQDLFKFSRDLIKSKCDLIVNGLDSQSSALWKNYFYQLASDKIVLTIAIYKKQRLIVIGKNSLELESKDMLFQFMVKIIETNKISLSDLTQYLWNEPHTNIHYDRLRILSQRANKLFKNKFNVTLLKFSQSGIESILPTYVITSYV